MDTQTDDSSGVFIVHTRFSSGNRQDGTTEISDQKVEIDYTFPKEIRNKISAISTGHKTRIYQDTLMFPPRSEKSSQVPGKKNKRKDDKNPNVLRMCRGDQVPQIEQIVQEADKELQEIDESLGADCWFFPLDMSSVKKGDLYGQVMSAIRYQILKETIDRIGEKTGQLNTQSKQAMERMVNRLRAINIFNDPAIDKMLNETYEKIISQDVAEVKKSLEAELSVLNQRAGFIDLS